MDLARKENNFLVFAALTVIVFIVYGNALFNGFVYDDSYLIVDNGFIKGFSHLRAILLNDTTVTTSLGEASGYYRPVPIIYLMITHKLWGVNPFGYHLQSILLHLFSTCLVFLVIERLVRKRKVAFFSALIFAVHPIHVEAVAPAYNVMGLLATSFSLSFFLLYVKSRQEKHSTDFILSIICLILAMFSKEEAMILPLVVMLYDLYFVFHLRLENLLKDGHRYLWLILAGILYLAMRHLAVNRETMMGLWHMNLYFNISPPPNDHVGWNLLIAAKVFFRYLHLLGFPVHLCAFQLVSTAWDFEMLSSVTVVLGLAILAFLWRTQYPKISFFIIFFFLSSLPVSNLIPIGGIFAERFMYFPSVSYCYLWGACFAMALEKQQEARCRSFCFIALIGGAIIVFFYSLQTAMRNYTWRNNVALWEDTVRKSPQNMLPHLNLASAYYHNRRYEDALKEYRAALAFPSTQKPYLYNAIGKIYGMKGDYELALNEFKLVNATAPLFPEGYYNTGITYFHVGQYDGASACFQKALEVDQNYPWGYYGLGLVYEKNNKPTQAVEMFRKAIKKDPAFTQAQNALMHLQAVPDHQEIRN